jgi:hypothetical protein
MRSRATAIGSWLTTRIQPFSAPNAEMAAPTPMRRPSQSPAITRAASANGAVDFASTSGATRLITAAVEAI